MSKIFDSHAHYDDPRFDADRDELLSSLLREKVCGIVNIGSDIESSKRSLEIAHKYGNVYAAVGVHPHEVDDLASDYIETLRTLASDNKAVAIGEIGLDRHYGLGSDENQMRAFSEQLALAKELDMPVVIHSREATDDTLKMVRKYMPRGVVHCFSGSAETAEEYVKMGMYIGFTGALTFKNARRAVEAVAATPIDRLLLETDCPYMAPEPNRGKRCDSSMIEFTAAVMAKIKGVSTDDMIRIAAENTRRLFNI